MADVVQAPSIVGEVDEKIALSWASFLDAIAGVPPVAMEEPGVTGVWSLKQLIGHVAFWDAWEAVDLSDKAAGKSVAEVDWQAENDRHGPKIATQPLDKVIAGLHRDHEAMVTQLRALGPHDLQTPALATNVLSSTTSHYDEHAAEIRAWRERTGN